MRTSLPLSAILTATLLLLPGCGSEPEMPAPTPTERPDESMITRTPPATPLPVEPAKMASCEASIGAPAAQALADQCRAVSPATRPPCNAANSCALIRDEIARSCELFADDPPAECGDRAPAERAADVVRRYYEAIEARDYATAYAQWADDGARSGKRPDDFAAGFASTRTTRVTIGKLGDVEGGAGSLYVEVPVDVTATLDNGHQQRFTGSYVVRRVNDVDGATPDQRRWHIDSAKLRAG